MVPKYVVPVTLISRIDIDLCQDLYPKYLTASKGFSEHDATIATIIGNCVSDYDYTLVACVEPDPIRRVPSREQYLSSGYESSLLFRGGAIAGYASQYLGRRLTIVYGIPRFLANLKLTRCP